MSNVESRKSEVGSRGAWQCAFCICRRSENRSQMSEVEAHGHAPFAYAADQKTEAGCRKLWKHSNHHAPCTMHLALCTKHYALMAPGSSIMSLPPSISHNPVPPSSTSPDQIHLSPASQEVDHITANPFALSGKVSINTSWMVLIR